MIVDLDTEPGMLWLRDSESILGLTLDARVTPDQALALADNLEREGKHTVAAEGLRRAAVNAAQRAAR